jgi:hypothetical protein
VQKFFTFADFQAKSRERGQIAVLDFLQYFLIKQKVRKKLILSFSRVGRFRCEFHNMRSENITRLAFLANQEYICQSPRKHTPKTGLIKFSENNQGTFKRVRDKSAG